MELCRAVGRSLFDFVTDDKRAFTITFSDLQVKVDEGDSALSSAAFSLILPLEGSTAGEKVEIEFAVTGAAGVQRFKAAVILRLFLFDNVGLDGHAQVIGLAGQVG